MPELELTPHPESERTYAELRSEFRADNLQRIRSEFAGHHPIGWNMIGHAATARHRYSAVDWAAQMLRHLDDPVAQDFGLPSGDCRNGSRLEHQLEKQAQAALLHESATWDDSVSGVTDHDAPPCPPVESMTDDELCDYIERSIKESANG